MSIKEFGKSKPTSFWNYALEVFGVKPNKEVVFFFVRVLLPWIVLLVAILIQEL